VYRLKYTPTTLDRSSSPARVKHFHFTTYLYRLLGPPSLLFSGYRGEKLSGREADHSLPTTAGIKKNVGPFDAPTPA
jgi:hypothetical protein